jgi:hypothetical protein
MKSRITLLIILPLLLFSATGMNNPREKKWTSLFNGKNLEGWNMKIAGFPLGENFGNTFRVENGIISIRYDQYGDNFNSRFGALYYNKKLSNYRLKVEYRFVGETAPGAPTWGFRDSGVQFHGQDPASMDLKQQFPVCLEYNLHGGNGKEDRPTGEICTPGTTVEIKGKVNESFCTLPDVKRTFHGDQWVTLEIDSKDGKFIHYVNGEEIMRFENPRYNPKHEYGKKFLTDSNPIIKAGYISIQSNSHPIDIRKVEIMEY